ncbi:MAG: EAL domain-containing protein [Cognaticolwellia sp.]|jgi:diguanylate cyclase (GGDEF)-like protein
MRIKSYLAMLVFACLLGAYSLEQVLSHYFNHVQTLAEKHNKHMLWAKDLERIENSASQFLVSSDLVIGSGNTYLIFGAKNMGNYLTTELSSLYSKNQFINLNTKINRAILNTNKINDLLDFIGNIAPSELKLTLSGLLTEYDPVSLTLSQDIQYLTKETQRIMTEEALALDEEKNIMVKVGWIARSLFLLIIFILWRWANSRICRPLNELIYYSHRALAGDGFKAPANAPTEIIELSNDFKNITQTLFHQASHDPLTELQNRRAFERSLTEIIADDDVNYFLCFVDLDYFKTINDMCGHAAGDEILVSVARILKESIRYKDIVARLGGDEFAILIKDCSVEKAMQIANSIKTNIRNLTYHCENESFQLSASIGIAPKVAKSTTTDLLHSADIACSSAKNSGRNTVYFFDINNNRLIEKKPEMLSVHQINHAINNDQFILYKQDIVSLQQKNQLKYFEILLRMKNANGKVVNPSCFLPIAERYQLSSKIDRWVIKAVCEYFCIHSAKLLDIDTIAINLSGYSLNDDELENFIIETLKNGPIPPEKICFEITQADAITSIQRARLFMDNIKSLGCEFSLDDFGTSHSSHAYIKALPTDQIKISGSYISSMLESEVDYTAIKSICEIAKIANQKIVAKFVEDQNVITALTNLGVDYAQGYYFSTPEALVK